MFPSLFVSFVTRIKSEKSRDVNNGGLIPIRSAAILPDRVTPFQIGYVYVQSFKFVRLGITYVHCLHITSSRDCFVTFVHILLTYW